MMRLLLPILIVALSLAVLPPPQVAAQTAQSQGAAQELPPELAPPPPFLARDLAAMCRAAEGSAQQSGCRRYLQAALTMYELIVAEGTELTWFCAPREAPAGLLRRQYLDWVTENGEQMELDAIRAVRLALADAFPCQE